MYDDHDLLIDIAFTTVAVVLSHFFFHETITFIAAIAFVKFKNNI